MKMLTKIATIVATTSLLVAGAVPVFAASARTEAFVANVMPNVDFLNESSRLALGTAVSPKTKAFARSEAIEQTITGNSLVAWEQTNTPQGVVAALGAAPIDGPLAPVGGLVAVPLDAAATVTGDVTSGVGGVLTGRSVAIDNPVAVVAPPPAAPLSVLPAGQADLSRLQTLTGHRFEAFYRSTQVDALRQLATLYTDYRQNGDDPALRAMADRQLPMVNRRLAELHAL